MSEAARLKALFFCYFAYVGVMSPYLSLYFRDLGYTVAQIGLLMTVPQVLRIVSPAFWGWLADRRGDVRLLLRASAVMALLAVAAMAGVADVGLVVAAVTLALLSFSAGAQVPIGEALTLRATGGDAGGYGRIRLWGSIGFILGVVGVGAILDRMGLASLPIWMAVALAGLLIAVWRIDADAPSAPRERALPLRRRLREPAVMAFFIANALMIFAHAALYVLYSLLLARQGYGETAIGLLWAVGVIAEIILFRVQRPLFAWQPATRLLVFSLLVAAARFTVIGLADGALAILIVCQLAHAVTFGLHHSAVMRILHEWFEPAEQGRAQAAYLAIAYGIGGSLGGLTLTRIWEWLSPSGAFVVAGLVAACGALIMLASRARVA
ncbi:MAG: MFS transporter [Burkholderiaceae bacterium]